MGKVDDILSEWDIKVPNDIYFPEYLMEQYPSKIFYIDVCPFVAGEKQLQVDLQYEEVISGSRTKIEYLEMEQKYRNVMRVLWIYNTTFVELGEMWVWHSGKRSIIDKEYRTLFRERYKNMKSTGNVYVEKRDELDLLVQLGIRGVVKTIFCLKEYEALIVPTYSCFILYLNDISKKGVIGDIVMTEGLYLRSFISK